MQKRKRITTAIKKTANKMMSLHMHILFSFTWMQFQRSISNKRLKYIVYKSSGIKFHNKYYRFQIASGTLFSLFYFNLQFYFDF